MKSRIKLFNKAIFNSTMKLNGWVSGLNFGFLFLFMLMPIMALRVEYKDQIVSYINKINGMLTFNGVELQNLILFTIPVILGVSVTRFLQNKSQNIHIHSMPVKKSQIYTTNIFAGIILLVLPVLLNAIIVIVLAGFENFGQISANVYNWTYITLALELVIYALSIFIGTIIGSSVIQTIFTYVFMVFPIGIYMLITFTLKILLPGFTVNERLMETALPMKMSLLPQAVMITSPDILRENLAQNLYLIYIISAAVLLLVSYFIYKIRKVEKTGDTVAFVRVNPIVKYGITFCFMLLIGLIVYFMYNESFTHMIIAYVITSLVAYFLSEMMVRKSVRVLDSYKGYLGYVIVMALIFTGIKMDITGFEKRIPNTNDIVKVNYDLNTDNNGDVAYVSNENKEAVRAINELIVKNKMYENKDKKNDANRVGQGNSYGIVYDGFINLQYELKDGSEISRQYSIFYTEETKKELIKLEQKIFNTEEYKKAAFEVYKNDAITKIQISTGNENEDKFISKPTEISELVEAMRKDTLALTYEQMTKDIDVDNKVTIEKYVSIKNKRNYEGKTYLYYNQDYKNTIEWLIAHNYYPKA